MNQQATTQPIILNCTEQDSKVELTLQLPDDLVYFQGHFPDQPILAGVVQLNWAVEFARKYLNIKGDITSVEVLKFQQLIKPDTKVQLSLELKADDKFVFAYNSSLGKHASGRVKTGS
jgi:3-hydroxymyristoyl/3-hydroxydecanoyl-(acyl carrier protein) dehydratase